MPRKSPPPKCDWVAARADWEAGNGSNQTIADKYGVSESAVRKHQKSEGWAPCGANRAMSIAARAVRELDGVRTDAPLAPHTPEQEAAALNAAARADAVFMRRVANAAKRSVDNCERILAAAQAALVHSESLPWHEQTDTDKSASVGQSFTQTVERLPSRSELAFEAGKANKIATEALMIARKTYAQARGLEEGNEGVNVNVQANQQTITASSPAEVVERMKFYATAAQKAIARESGPVPAEEATANG